MAKKKSVPVFDGVLVDDGALRSDGKSCNVWVNITFPKDLLYDMVNNIKTKTYHYDPITGAQHLVTDKKLCVWTAYDDYIYDLIHQHNADNLSTKQIVELIHPQIPKISATFKSCFDDYAAVTENIGYQVARVLDMPTSYNYIVEFNPDNYPAITSNYSGLGRTSGPKAYGIVSIDFLQQKKAPLKVSETMYKGEDIPSYSEIEGDRLISFEDAFKLYNLRIGGPLTNDANKIENWLNAVDEVARKELLGCPRERVNKELAHVHSRIARSFLLREFLGDCDFTAYNGGMVINKATMRLRYAPNYDFGDSFNGLRKKILRVRQTTLTEEQELAERGTICGLPPAVFNKQSEAIKTMLRNQTYGDATPASMEEVASLWSSGISEENFDYVMKNFPDSADEFFVNLDVAIMKGEIDHIIDDFAGLTCKGEELLAKEEIDLFKDYLYSRAEFMCSKFIEWRHSHGLPIPNELDYEHSIFCE